MTAGLVVIGGGAAGHAAVQAFRESDGQGSVTLLSADDHLPYNRPPLSKDYLRGESEATGLLLAQAEFYRDNDIDVLLSETAVELDTSGRTVRTGSGLELPYSQCVLALGSTPNELPIPGGGSALKLRWLEQAAALREVAQVAASAVVIGSGFIGCEAAVSLATRGLSVTMVSTEQQPQLNRLGPDAAGLITGWLEAADVTLLPEAEITSITGGRFVHLSGGTTLSADLILAAVGVTPNTEVARQAGLEMTDARIVVDASMRTSAPGVFAAGDAAFAYNTAAGRHLSVEHWGDADAMGGIAGTVAAGGAASWATSPGFWSEIGSHTLKYTAWGDGYDSATPVGRDDGGLTIWYGKTGIVVGVLTSGADDDYEMGSKLIVAGSPLPV